MSRLLIAFAALSALTPSPAHAQKADAFVFENVTVIPMDRERRLPDRAVVVRGGRIAEIGPSDSVRAPEGALRIDGRGKFLIPGLAEMHGHFPGPQAITQLGQAYGDRLLFLFVANGVTTVRGMLGGPRDLQVRADVARGERLGPQLFVAGPSFNGQSVPTVEAAWRAVTDQRAAGYDLLKIHPGVRREVFDEVVAQARREGIPFAGHIPEEVGLTRALLSGIRSVEHLDGYVEAMVRDRAVPEGTNPGLFGYGLLDYLDESRLAALAAATRSAGAWNAPTLVLIENRFTAETPEQVGERPEMRYLPAPVVKQWVDAARAGLKEAGPDAAERGRRFVALRRRIVRALRDAGAGLLLGADTPQVFNVPGFATIQELEALVAAGLTPYQALEAGTRNPALALGLEASFGTVEAGKRADLVLLDADPLADIRNIRRRAGVMVAGRWH